MKTEYDLKTLTLAQLVCVHNLLVEGPDGDESAFVKKFASKAAAVARIEAIPGGAFGVEVLEDDIAVQLLASPEDQEPEDPTEGIEPEGIDPTEDAEDEPTETEAPADAPFVKATKEELAAMDGPTRARYRKDRRAAARRARKAK